MLRAVGKRVGDKMKIMYDAGCHFNTLADALEVGKVCDEYNKMSEQKLSDLILASSILVLSVIMNSTYKDLGVETDEIPELFKWCEKAREILQHNLVK